MQKLETIKNHSKTMKLTKGDKKSKITSNSKKTAKKDLQFTEILGQFSLPMPPTKAAAARPSQAAQPETVVSTVNPAKARKESVGKPDHSNETVQGKTEFANTSSLSNKSIKLLVQANGNESTGEVADQLDSNQLKASITGKKDSGWEKSLVARTVGELVSDVTSTNMGNSSESAIRASANIMRTQVSSAAKSIAGTTREKHRASDSNLSKLVSQGEIKIADLMLANNTGTIEKPASQSFDKKLISRQEASIRSTSSVRIGDDSAVNNKENTKNNGKEEGSDSRGAKTPITTKESANNGSVISDNRVGKFKVAEFEGVNVENTMLSKSQADFLVSKMIEQIKVAPSSLEVSLKPEYLGKVNIIVQSVAGVISVNVIAQNPEALNLVNSNLQNIKDNLEQQGINVQQLEVNLANQEKQNNRNSHGFNGQNQAVRPVEKTNTLIEYGILSDSVGSSLLSHNLNLLA